MKKIIISNIIYNEETIKNKKYLRLKLISKMNSLHLLELISKKNFKISTRFKNDLSPSRTLKNCDPIKRVLSFQDKDHQDQA